MLIPIHTVGYQPTVKINEETNCYEAICLDTDALEWGIHEVALGVPLISGNRIRKQGDVYCSAAPEGGYCGLHFSPDTAGCDLKKVIEECLAGMASEATVKEIKTREIPDKYAGNMRMQTAETVGYALIELENKEYYCPFKISHMLGRQMSLHMPPPFNPSYRKNYEAILALQKIKWMSRDLS